MASQSYKARLEAQLVNCSVKGGQNANAMFKSLSFGFANSCRFVLVLLLCAFRVLRNSLTDAVSQSCGSSHMPSGIQTWGFLSYRQESTGSSISCQIANNRSLIFLESSYPSTGMKIGSVQGERISTRRNSMRFTRFIALPLVMAFVGC